MNKQEIAHFYRRALENIKKKGISIDELNE